MPTADTDLLNAAPAGFLTFRDDGRVTAVNDFLLELLGHGREDVVGRHVEGLMGVAGRIFFQTHLFPLVRMHGRAEEIYVELRSKAGDRVPVLLNARRVEDPPRGEGAALTHCVFMRVRERKKFEDELLRAKKRAEAASEEARAANRAKSLYLRSVSHEIRTPINALLGYADLLDLGAGEPMGEKQIGYVQRVRKAARHLLMLVNDLLDLAKIESGAMRVEAAEEELAKAAESALAMVEPQAGEQEVEVVRTGSRPGRYVGDHERVIQILLNLLSNAVKFTAPGGRVELDWARVEKPEQETSLNGARSWLRVRVMDTGIGIPADELEEVFQPFSQVNREDARKGTGLGLTISRELARLMNGDITVRSTPREGSTFTLWLPAVQD